MERTEHDVAREPEDLAWLFVQRANAGDVEGLVALYEDEAVLATGDDEFVHGVEEIRAFYTDFVASGPTFIDGQQSPALRLRDLALTSTRLTGGGATAEVARRQADGTWRWVLDRPNVVAEAVQVRSDHPSG
ncbi:MAG: YybH family protein [Pseudonocardiaceae bacterium]